MSGPVGSIGEELVASESRLRAILGCTKGIVFEFDRDARYLNLWTHDEELLVRPRGELLGHTITEIFGEEGGRLFTDAVRRVYDTGVSETLEYELVVRGGRRWFVADVLITPPTRKPRTHGRLPRSRHHRAQAARGAAAPGAEDGSDRPARRRHRARLQQHPHDDHRLQRAAPRGPRARHAASASTRTRIRQAADRAAALTKQLLAYGRKQMLVPEVLDLNVVISGMADMLRRLIGEHIELAPRARPQPRRCKRRSLGQLEQVIMNLAVNARDAMRCRRRPHVPHRLRRARRGVLRTTGSSAVLAATCSHRERHRRRAWTPRPRRASSSRSSPPRKSARARGSASRRFYGIVKQSGGHIEVDSEPGHGATFRVYLPRDVTKPRHRRRRHAAPPDRRPAPTPSSSSRMISTCARSSTTTCEPRVTT